MYFKKSIKIWKLMRKRQKREFSVGERCCAASGGERERFQRRKGKLKPFASYSSLLTYTNSILDKLDCMNTQSVLFWKERTNKCMFLKSEICTTCLRQDQAFFQDVFVKKSVLVGWYLSKSGSTFAFFFWLILLLEPPPFFIGIWKASTRTNSPLLCNTVSHIPHSSDKEQYKPYCQNNSSPDKLVSLETLALFIFSSTHNTSNFEARSLWTIHAPFLEPLVEGCKWVDFWWLLPQCSRPRCCQNYPPAQTKTAVHCRTAHLCTVVPASPKSCPSCL